MDCGVGCCGNVGWASYSLGDQEINLSVPQFPHLQNAVCWLLNYTIYGKALDTVPGNWQGSKKAHLLSFCAERKV